MDNLEVGCLVSASNGIIGRVTRIEDYRDDGRTTTNIWVERTASEQGTWYAPDRLEVIAPATRPPISKGLSLKERRLNLIGYLYNLKHATPLPEKRLIDKVLNAVEFNLCGWPRFWFWSTVAESLDDPRKISFAKSKELVDNDTQRRFCSYAKFLKGIAKEMGLSFSDEDIDKISNLIGVGFPDSRDYTFEILSGEDIVKTYSDTPESWNSCMSKARQVHWYAVNPGKVNLLKIYQGGMYCGRALLWTADDGSKILDRIYPSDNGPQTIAAHNYAEKQGWDYKTVQSAVDGKLKSGKQDYIVTMSTKSSNWSPRKYGYPYLDTFKYSPKKPRAGTNVKLHMVKKRVWFADTTGKYTFSGPTCYCCGRNTDPEEIILNWSSHRLCSRCARFKYARVDYIWDNTEYLGLYMRISEVQVCRTCNEWRLVDHLTGRTHNQICTLCQRRRSEHTASPSTPTITFTGYSSTSVDGRIIDTITTGTV